MKIFEKYQLLDKTNFVHKHIYICDYCGKEFNTKDNEIYDWITPNDNGFITQEFFYIHDDLNSDFILDLYTNNGDFHFCPDEDGEHLCEINMIRDFINSNEYCRGVCGMLYKARDKVIRNILNKKTYSMSQLTGEDNRYD